ncbi:1,6-anhydro-N-acetylmuramyl-L-alanine amidase AmpD [Vandammella animalimorsus]|uniref:1,6-anhydro-N-acetylmuramyl-L-alanine amidase AmpD n=1 Tax=Vandammella animalimorsus TaxID=2029117 RepID=A0A2A2AQA5_9BURK|nr:1,6-anhydro-N-acetylmuramyl-L-alanine amidase AmpD [Vandammella animalimorsus]PAT39911.1 1,6-anhydro-N-acetylmuramyl-L-alanine amidase AmpD [Vandammella animalimorsus]
MPQLPPTDNTAQAQDWQGGRYLPAQWIASPNCDARPDAAQIDLIVLHSISLPPGVFEGQAVQQLFTNTLDWDAHPYFQGIRGLRVSAHFFIRRDGRLIQFVDADARAWHAGQSCYDGRRARNDDSIGIELEGLEGGLFTSQQYQALTPLCQALRARYPIAHIAGHEHIAPGRKHDPGPGFDWARLQQQLQWPPAMFPT